MMITLKFTYTLDNKDHRVRMVLMNSSKLKLSMESIFSSLNSSLSYSSLIFSPELTITFLNSFLVNIEAKFEPYFSLSFRLKIDRIASINYYSDSGYLYLLRLFVKYLAMRARKSANSNLPFFYGSTMFAHYPSYFSVGFWYRERISNGRSYIYKIKIPTHQRSYRCLCQRVEMPP